MRTWLLARPGVHYPGAIRLCWGSLGFSLTSSLVLLPHSRSYRRRWSLTNVLSYSVDRGLKVNDLSETPKEVPSLVSTWGYSKIHYCAVPGLSAVFPVAYLTWM